MDFEKQVEALKEDIISSTQEIIRIKSVEEPGLPGMPFGKGNSDALERFLELGKKLGFTPLNLDGYAGHLEMGEGSETVGILAHLDVVPEGDGWTYPPYGAEIHDGKIFGRGAIDDKGPAMAALYAMKAIKDSGVPLKRKVRLILGSNEETGWKCMDHYFANMEEPDMSFTPDAEFPVIHGEKGIIVFKLRYQLRMSDECDINLVDIAGGTAPNMVPDSAKAVLKVKDKDLFMAAFNKYVEETTEKLILEDDGEYIIVRTEGISAHGSTPEKGVNAITILMKFLKRAYSGGCSFCRFIDFYNERLANKLHGESIGCGFEDEISGKLNFNTGMIEMNNGYIDLTINIRYPISSSSREVYDGIRENLKDFPIELIEGEKDQKPLYVPKDDFLVSTLMKVYQEHTKDYDSEPVTIGGGTYARATKNAVAFGPVYPGEIECAHQKDEFISIDKLIDITKLYAKAIYQLATQ
ncbi:MAG: dipeptidase PepV [Gudongella sp.]|jgi:succinyl-diaminopimelate desuccinylase|nr:dipeptidase PepV [Gudongella sp.]